MRPRLRPTGASLALLGLLLTATSACTTDDARPDVPSASAAPTPRHVVEMEGERVRPFLVPTLAEFTQDPFVTNVIEGTVTATRPLVTQPANVVETILTVDVTRQRDEDRPKTVEVREQGGLVKVSQVRSDFEGKLGRELEPGELDQWVDFRSDGAEHAAIGEQVLIVVGSDSDRSKDAYVGLARLKRSGDGGYGWSGRSPNPRWETAVDAEALLSPSA